MKKEFTWLLWAAGWYRLCQKWSCWKTDLLYATCFFLLFLHLTYLDKFLLHALCSITFLSRVPFYILSEQVFTQYLTVSSFRSWCDEELENYSFLIYAVIYFFLPPQFYVCRVNWKSIFRFLLGRGAEWKAALLLVQKCGIWGLYTFFMSSMPVGIKLRILYCGDGCSWCASRITIVHFHVLEMLNFFIYEKVVGLLVFVYFYFYELCSGARATGGW